MKKKKPSGLLSHSTITTLALQHPSCLLGQQKSICASPHQKMPHGKLNKSLSNRTKNLSINHSQYQQKQNASISSGFFNFTPDLIKIIRTQNNMIYIIRQTSTGKEIWYETNLSLSAKSIVEHKSDHYPPLRNKISHNSISSHGAIESIPIKNDLPTQHSIINNQIYFHLRVQNKSKGIL